MINKMNAIHNMYLDIYDKYFNNQKESFLLNFLIIFFVFFLSIGFSSFSKVNKIGDISAVVRIENDIRVNSVISESDNDAYTNWDDYNVSSISSGLELPSENSYIIYNVEIIVFGSNEYGIASITGLPDNLDYEIYNYNIDEKICSDTEPNKCTLGAIKNIQIKVKYGEGKYDSSNTSFLINIDFNFKAIHNIYYININNNNLPSYAIEDKQLNITLNNGLIGNLSVYTSDSNLYSGIDYTFDGNNITIYKVKDDIYIEDVPQNSGETIILNNEISDGCPERYLDTNYYIVDTELTDATTPKFCQAVDNYGDTYYFRGPADNNYVSFAGLEWRILRINGDGTIRLVLNGTTTEKVSWQSNTKTDNAYAGFMYGKSLTSTTASTSYNTAQSNKYASELANVLNSWYTSNILSKSDSQYVADILMYNDRSTFSFADNQLFASELIHYKDGNIDFGIDTGKGYGTNITYYGSWYRIMEQVERYYTNGSTLLSNNTKYTGRPISYPTYYCANKNDCFTNKATTIGNGKLKYPIGTLTLDDIVFAGQGYKEKSANPDAFIQISERYTIATVGSFDTGTTSGTKQISNCTVFSTHTLGNGWVTCSSRSNYVARPVINIKADTGIIAGNGSKSEPYVFGKNNIEENTSQANIEEVVSEMTLDEKIGQMIVLSGKEFQTSLDEDTENIIDTVNPGGIILFSNNISDKTQLKNLMSDINYISKTPLIWSIDQEGGIVQRLKSSNVGATTIPKMYTVGSKGDATLTQEVGRVVGEELGVFGFNMDFAPVADIWSNSSNTVIGQRSFGTTADVVSTMSFAFAQGLESTGVTAVYKHFPGHGDTITDSHSALPVITKTKEELMNLELIPFKNAIDNGAKVIMVGHLAVSSLTGSNQIPTSLSKETITDFLKTELGFNGLVITDALDMDALLLDGDGNTIRTIEDVYVMAVNAGVDLLLAPTSAVDAFNTIKQAVADGEIPISRIDEAVNKILEYKSSINVHTYDESYLGSQEHQFIINLVS